jgi:hypothetical protein
MFEALRKASEPQPPKLTGSKPHDDERMKVLWEALREVRDATEYRVSMPSLDNDWSLPDGKRARLRYAESSAKRHDRLRREWKVLVDHYDRLRAATNVSDKLAAIDRLDPLLIRKKREEDEAEAAEDREIRIGVLTDDIKRAKAEIARLESEGADDDS